MLDETVAEGGRRSCSISFIGVNPIAVLSLFSVSLPTTSPYRVRSAGSLYPEFDDTNNSFSRSFVVDLCGARIAGAKTPPILPFANNAGANLSCFVRRAKRR